MVNARLAVKAFIINKENKLLLLKRDTNDSHKPGEWDIPGGRADLTKDPLEELKREVLEEAGIDISIHIPLHVQYFVRDDGQTITMIIFLCTPESTNIKLSDEHSEYKYVSIEKDNIPKWIWPILNNFNKFQLYRHINHE